MSPRSAAHEQVPRTYRTLTASVALAMIVRNEEQNLSRCLESVKGLFNELVVVDTGSTDLTKEIAQQFGARIIEFDWADDFSAARNVSLANATSDYVFWLDADDVMDAPERNKLETLIKDLRVEPRRAFVVRCSSDPNKTSNGSRIVVDHVRLFPVDEQIRWKYKVHEQILPALTCANIPIVWTDITVRHTGYADSDVKERKRARDWAILVQELSDSPDEPFVLFNLGMISFERQRWQEALGSFQKSLKGLGETGTPQSVRRKLYAMIAWTQQILRSYEEALRICEAGLAEDNRDAELWFRKAVIYRHQRKTIEAEACWHHILRLQRPEIFCSIDQGIYGHLTRRNLALIAQERGEHAKAQEHWRAILAECPGDQDAINNILASK